MTRSVMLALVTYTVGQSLRPWLSRGGRGAVATRDVARNLERGGAQLCHMSFSSLAPYIYGGSLVIYIHGRMFACGGIEASPGPTTYGTAE